MSSDGDSIIYPAIGFGAGIYLFFKGFKEFRNYRLMADTPVVPIRSLAMGRVEIYGTARGELQVVSPVSHTNCYWYKVVIEKRTKDSKGRESWSHFATDVNGVQFDIEDASGKVRVNALNADLDLNEQCKLERYGDTYTERAKSGTAVPHFVNASRPDAAPEVAASPEALPIASVQARQQMEQWIRERRTGQVAAPQSAMKLFSFVRSINISSGGGTGRFRLTEYCIIPGRQYHISGTCTENPSPRDEQDRNLICKGENEPFFHISWRTEAEDEKHFRRRAVGFIFGGAALSVVCLAILLNSFDVL